LVACSDLAVEQRTVDVGARDAELACPPAGANLLGGHEVELERSVREDDGAAIPAHRHGSLDGESALGVEQCRANLGDAAHRGEQRRVGGISKLLTGVAPVDARVAVALVVGGVGVDVDDGVACA